jgi:hypothetical protein
MTTTLVRLTTSTAPPPSSGRPKLTLVDDHGTRVVLPFAPVDGPLTNLAPRWEEVARSGQRPPLLVLAGPNLTRLDLEATVTNTRNPTASAELYVYALTVLARQARRVFLRNYGILVGNPWRITGFGATPFRRTADNAIAGFTASLSLTAAVDPVVRVGPVSGGARAITPPAARTVTVRAGETSAALAYRALGDTSAATALLDANGIRDARSLTAGMVLKVP